MNNPLSFAQRGPEPVFGHARFCDGCATLAKPQGTERVPLIPQADRGGARSSLWESHIFKAVTQQL